ncbi:phage tail tape measure protein [uncultured Alistipes sp.]|uniref:phage tail tape measure protein n=1 Tax=uncultured Alistipes sp. TaxID=538949 RepID=UPI00259A9F98|nr:phage tail tape measure protein [uncultured Alistipes sp.]
MANVVEKIFKLILNFGDGEEKVPKMSKLLQSLHDRLKNVLKTINDIGKADGLQKAAEVLGVYTLTVEKAEKAKKKLVATDKEEKTQTAEATKYIEDLKNKYGNLIFTKREITTLSKNYATLMRAEKGSAEELQAKINVLNTVWKKLGATQRNSTMGRQVTAELKSMRDEMRNLTVGAGDFSRNIGNYFSGMYNTVTRKVAGITGVVFTLKQVLWSIYGPFQDLEYRMAMVKAVSRATDEEFAMLKGNARELGASTEYTATEVAGLQLAYARMGFVPDQIRQITGATLDLATATGEDLARSADVVGVTLRGFNLQADQAQRVVDVMTKSFNASSLQLGYFYDAIKYVAPIASEANVSLEETAAMLGVLADRGIRGSQAGTALRRIFTEIAKTGGDVSERLAQLSKNGLTLGGAMDEVGRYAMTALTVLVNSKDGVDGLTESLNNAGGAAKTAADGIRNTMKIDVEVFLSAIKEKLIAIGEVLAPLGRSVIQAGTWAVTNIKSVTITVLTLIGVIKLASAARAVWLLVTKQITIYETAWGRALRVNMVELQTATAMTKLLAAAKLLLTGQIKAAAVAFKMFTAALMANPWGVVATAIAAVIAYMVAFRDKTDAATRAQRKFNDENDRFNKAQDEKRQRIEQLIRTIQDETETQNAKIRAYEELKLLSPALTAKYTQEQLATLKLADSAKFLNEQRDKENYDNLIANVEKYTASLKKLREENGQLLGMSPGGAPIYVDNSKAIEEQEIALSNYKKALGEIEEARKVAEENVKPLEVRIKAAEDIVEEAEKAFKEAKTAYNQKRDEWIREHGTEATLPFSFKFDMLTAQKEFADAQKKVADLQKQLKIPTTGGGSEKEKGEWSLSKDKEYNRQLLDLKKKLHSGEITSEEQYQKQVLQLEIDTLTKRITLNKDEAKTIIKLKNELWDKQNQQKKNEQKEDEAYTANRRAQQEKQLKYENDRIDAEIAAMKEGVEKKIRLNDQATKKAEEAAYKEYQTELDKLNKEQKAYVKGSKEWQAVEQEKTRLAGLYEQKKSDIATAGTNARTKILQDATTKELKEYKKVEGAAIEAEQAITANKMREMAKRIKLAESDLSGAEKKYLQNENVADAVYGTDTNDKERHAAKLKNEIELREAKAQTYLQILGWLQENGLEETAFYNQTIENIGRLKKETQNLGKGLESDGSGGGFKGWLMRTFELKPEEVEQLEQQAWDLASRLSDALIDAQMQASKRRLNNEKKAIDAQYKTEAKLLDSKRDKGLISEKKYQQELEKLEAKKAEKEEAAERAAFEREKKLNVKQVLMNTALSVAKTFAQWGWPMGIPFAALAIAEGAIQIATIQSQKYAQGGMIPLGDGVGVVKGRSHAQGGHQIYLDGQPIGEVEGDELLAIVNKRDTARIGALSAANSVHGRRFAQGGLMSPTGYMTSSVSGPVSFYQTSTHQDETAQGNFSEMMALIREDIKATNDRIDRLRVYLVTQDVTDSQDDLKKIKVKQSF